ncbi:hypothetical protein GQ473_02495 [archaeon]|nr:hypothetical protein [archaeon]
MYFKKGSSDILLTIIAVITLVIGFIIVDGVLGDAVTPGGVINESVGIANATGYLAGTLTNIPVIAATDYILCNGTLSTNYTLTDKTGVIVVDGADCINDTVLASYQYEDSTYFSSNLTRTIANYIVPIGLLGILMFVGFMRLKE